MNKGDYWFKFVFSDWRTDPALRRCSMATQGVWINMLCVMHESASSSVSGTVTELARLVGCFPDELASAIDELEATGTADVTRSAHTPSVTCNAQVTLGNEIVTVMSRRLDRQVKSKEQTRLRVQRFRANGDVTLEKQDRVRDRDKSKNIELTKDLTTTVNSSSRREHAREVPADAGSVSSRGCRIPSRFIVTKAMRQWLTESLPTVDVKVETEKFVNHYRSITGRNAERADWVATWKNWMLRAEKDYQPKKTAHGGNGNGQAKRSNAEKLNDIGQMLQQKYG